MRTGLLILVLSTWVVVAAAQPATQLTDAQKQRVQELVNQVAPKGVQVPSTAEKKKVCLKVIVLPSYRKGDRVLPGGSQLGAADQQRRLRESVVPALNKLYCLNSRIEFELREVRVLTQEEAAKVDYLNAEGGFNTRKYSTESGQPNRGQIDRDFGAFLDRKCVNFIFVGNFSKPDGSGVGTAFAGLTPEGTNVSFVPDSLADPANTNKLGHETGHQFGLGEWPRDVDSPDPMNKYIGQLVFQVLQALVTERVITRDTPPSTVEAFLRLITQLVVLQLSKNMMFPTGTVRVLLANPFTGGPIEIPVAAPLGGNLDQKDSGKTQFEHVREIACGLKKFRLDR